MTFINDNGQKRVAYAEDYNDTTISLTPAEWQELVDLLEYRKQTKPCVFSRRNAPILRKLKENPPKLKPCYTEIKVGQ